MPWFFSPKTGAVMQSSNLVQFDLGQNVSLVYLLIEPYDLFGGPTWAHRCFEWIMNIPIEGAFIARRLCCVADCSGNEAERPVELATPLASIADASVK